VGPCFTAGHLVETNAAWRSERPVVTAASCTGCNRCVLACPDGAVSCTNAKALIDYDFCKGCGLCVRECPADAIRMIPEKNTEKKNGA
jgi:2-oxoacid:acceptor oxidoreductase delta subunit (pyruvate/2-ketoisovalerate family)